VRQVYNIVPKYAGRTQRLSPLPLTRVVAVDCDGTLDVRGCLNERVRDYCVAMREDGWTLILWSAAGEQHARQTAERHGVVGLFDLICGKPGIIVDDLGWDWTQNTQVIRAFE
jgi:hypothetical protein